MPLLLHLWVMKMVSFFFLFEWYKFQAQIPIVLRFGSGTQVHNRRLISDLVNGLLFDASRLHFFLLKVQHRPVMIRSGLVLIFATRLECLVVKYRCLISF